jgi:hypothetical protein
MQIYSVSIISPYFYLYIHPYIFLVLSPEQDLFNILVLHFSLRIHCQSGICHGISPVNILYFYQIKPFVTLFYPFLPAQIQ